MSASIYLSLVTNAAFLPVLIVRVIYLRWRIDFTREVVVVAPSEPSASPPPTLTDHVTSVPDAVSPGSPLSWEDQVFGPGGAAGQSLPDFSHPTAGDSASVVLDPAALTALGGDLDAAGTKLSAIHVPETLGIAAELSEQIKADHDAIDRVDAELSASISGALTLPAQLATARAPMLPTESWPGLGAISEVAGTAASGAGGVFTVAVGSALVGEAAGQLTSKFIQLKWK